MKGFKIITEFSPMPTKKHLNLIHHMVKTQKIIKKLQSYKDLVAKEHEAIKVLKDYYSHFGLPIVLLQVEADLLGLKESKDEPWIAILKDLP